MDNNYIDLVNNYIIFIKLINLYIVFGDQLSMINATTDATAFQRKYASFHIYYS